MICSLVMVEQIAAQLEKLPPALQREALDFIEFLAQKATRQEAAGAEEDWMRFSLAQAMEGLDEEDGPEYSAADLQERWQ